MKLLQAFIDQHLEYLYSIRPRDLDYGQTAFAVDLDLVPEGQLTGRQKSLLYKDKLKYADYLLTVTEAKIMARRAHIRNATIATIYDECRDGVGYNQKNSYLEDRIEATNSYFNNLDDLNNKGAEMEKTKKQLFKLNRALREMEAAGKIIKADPVAILEALGQEDEKAKAAANKSVEESDIGSPLAMDDPSPLKTAQPTAKQLDE